MVPIPGSSWTERRSGHTVARVPLAFAGRHHMPWKSFPFLIAALLFSTTVAAKGNFQAEGKLFEVRKSGEEVTFRFVGGLSLTYLSTATTQNLITLESADVVVHIRNWTQEHNPSVAAGRPDTERVFTALARLAETGRAVKLSIDNPSLTFSNVGRLTELSGTYVYARESGK
jgi:hypothetical protein